MNKAKRTRISAYALIYDDQKILMCRLSKEVPRWMGYWTLPGGGIEFGESPEAAVVREVMEETGLEVVPKSVLTIDSITSDSEEESFHGIRIVYEVELKGGQLRNETNGTTDQCAWQSFDRITELKLVSVARIGLDLARERNTTS